MIKLNGNYNNAVFYLVSTVLGIIFSFGILKIIEISFQQYLIFAVIISGAGLFYIIYKGIFTSQEILAKEKSFLVEYCKSRYNTQKDIQDCMR